MRITNVRAVHPPAPEAPRDWRSWLGQILIAVDTDRGLTGYGVGGGGSAGVHVVHTVLRQAVLGQDTSDIEGLWSRMHRHILPFGPDGLAMMALSGVDLALWDLLGKNLGRPVAELLGGCVETPVPAYATVSSLDQVERARDENYRAVKLRLVREAPAVSVDPIVDFVRRARDLLGPEAQLMADAFMGWDVETTLCIAGRIAEYGLAWLEEPLPPDDLEGYARLRTECPIPIAGGEHIYTLGAFEEVMRKGLHAVVQPDACWCGGLTQLLRVYKMADRYGLRVCPHRGSETWALHAIAAVDKDPMAESGRPWMTWVCDRPSIEGGMVRLGKASGFGVTFDPSFWRADQVSQTP